jgi:hypothetical protein
LALAALLGGAGSGDLVAAEETPAAAASPLLIEAIAVEPTEPGPETLCKLRIKIRNGGGRPASSLRFAVKVAGHSLPVYGNQLFMYPLAPGAATEVRLYNFWTTETGRPAPPDGKLTVEVALTEARWLKLTTDPDGVEVWEPLEPVPGLPIAKSVTLPLKVSAPAPQPSG